jgi:hypothetical protein
MESCDKEELDLAKISILVSSDSSMCTGVGVVL